MRLLMISGDRSILQGKKGAFWYTLEELCKHWERIDVITPRANELRMMNKELRNPFPNVFFHPSPRGLWYQPWWILIKGDELIKEHHHDVMTVQEYPPFYNGLGARWLHRSTNIPYMTEVHHIVGYPQAANLIEWIGYWMSRVWLPRWGTSQAESVRVVNGEVEKLLKEWKVTEAKITQLRSLYLDFETLIPDPTIHKTYDVVFCARIVRNKGLSELIQAVAQLRDKTLLVIGDGPERQSCEALAKKLHVDSHVKFVGWLEGKEAVYRAMQSARVFVMNSKSEGGPRVLFEAMALGMPCIATYVGLIRDLNPEKDTFVCTTGQPADLAEKIMNVLSDTNFQEEAKKNILFFKTAYDRRALMKKYADSLLKIAKRPHS